MCLADEVYERCTFAAPITPKEAGSAEGATVTAKPGIVAGALSFLAALGRAVLLVGIKIRVESSYGFST